MKKLLLPLFILTQFIFADPPDWADNPGSYEYSMHVSVAVLMGGVIIGDEFDMFAAFAENGNVRGMGFMLEPPFGPYSGAPLWDMTIRANFNDDVIYFQYYDASQDEILSISDLLLFEADAVYGSMVDPMFFNIGDTPEPPCQDDDAAVFPLNCSMAADNFGCDFLFAGTPIYEFCPVTCGTCPDDCSDDDEDGICNDVDDCFGELDECGICNGDGIADGACDCDGNVDIGCGCGEAGPSGCDYACGSTAVLDECGVCNGGGIADGECDCYGNIADCTGDCGGSAVVDACGVCAGPATSSDDCNGDGELDVCEDIANQMYDLGFFDGQETGDGNHDGSLNVTDIILFIDIILNQGTDAR